MAFRGITFSAQNVTPKNDGALYNAHYGDGILEGCTMAISGDDLVIQSGHFIACGRVCQVDGATNVDLSGRTLQTGYIQVVINYDLSQGEGQQWYTTFVESATTTFPALTKEDINTPSGILYQLQLAVVQISGGNLTTLVSSFGTSPVAKASPDGTIYGRIQASNYGASFAGTDATLNTFGGIYVNSSNKTNVFSDGGGIYLQPNGNTLSAGQVEIDSSGLITTSGNIRLYKSTPTIQFYHGGSNVASITVDNAYNLTHSSGSGYRISGGGYSVMFGNGNNLQFRPNGADNTNGQVQINSGGVIIAPGVYSTTRSGSTLVIDSSGNIGRTSSLRKYKKNIEDVTEKEAEKGYRLRPITYQSAIEDDIEERQYGFIAEEVEKVIPELCTYDLDGNVDGVAYERVCALLLKQNQMLKARVDALENRVEKLEAMQNDG